MTVRSVIEGTVALVVLLVLVLIGWETHLATNEIANMKAEISTRHDPAGHEKGTSLIFRLSRAAGIAQGELEA